MYVLRNWRDVAKGRLCEWKEDPKQPAKKFSSFGAYQRSLSLNCQEGTVSSVADLGCLSPDLNFCPFRIPDPGTKNREGWKKVVVIPLFVATNITILQIFSFWTTGNEEKMCVNLQKIIELLHQKLSLSSHKYRYGIRNPEKTYPRSGVKKAPDPGSGSSTLTVYL